MRRREFVQRLPVITSGIAMSAASLAVSGCAGVRYVNPRVAPGQLLVDASSLSSESAIFVQTPSMERPIYLRLTPSGEATAVLATCTHLGCQPEPVGDRFVCPCHGSQFAFDGAVLQGPAERPLRRYQVTRERGDFVIWLRERRQL